MSTQTTASRTDLDLTALEADVRPASVDAPVHAPVDAPVDAGVFERHESAVRSYCRSWPVVFDTAVGSWMTTTDGTRYLDLFAGAGALNYGHNPPALKGALLEHLLRDGVTHGLDMHTTAKARFLTTFHELVLAPRGLPHRVMFPGPTGANAVEAALKVARRATGRTGVVFFTDAFHGMSLGALSVTGNSAKRRGAGVPLHHTTPVPYDRSVAGADHAVLERLLGDPSSGLDLPAAVIVETVQGEGGLTAARAEWLQALAALCHRHEVLLIVDDVQMGVGRTGGFFSFEEAGITPDVVVLSKSISGYGLPMSLVLIRPEVDVWKPGEHNGTFRGNNPAFVTAEAALRTFWADDALERSTLARGERVHDGLCQIVADVVRRGGTDGTVRGRGLARGLVLAAEGLAGRVAAEAFSLGLLVETSGPHDEVVKLLPALTTSDDDLDTGLALLSEATARALA